MNDTAFILTLAASVGAAVPIALAALGELLAEKAGVLNLGVEGMMLIGAVTAFQIGDSSGSLWLALLAGCPGVETYLWRPADLERIAEVLR